MRRIYAALLVAMLFALLGCGIDNTMYNARKYFDMAQDRPLNANGRPAPQAVSDYTKAIKKCGIILSDGGKGKRSDDALFLMARALFYKGNSAFQAKDAFESLIRGYPDSKHVPESYIYLGKVLRDINQVAESEAVLERFIRDPKYVKNHPRALLVMADFEIQDEDYHRAQFWLERIIKDYRKTPEFKEAAFLFGKNYYVQGEYELSLQEFEAFIRTRGIPKPKKLEARYYIALNHLEIGEYGKALKEAKYLVRNEERPDMLSRARVLYGRALLADGKIESGLKELKEVTTSYPRTESSADAFYYWGNYLYYNEGKIDEAVPHLNRVRTEFAQSPLAEKGTRMATAINKTKPPAKLDSSSELEAWLDYHYLKAENLISPLALPDSALATYQRVISERDSLAAEQDSLQIKIEAASPVIDSLIAILPPPAEIAEQDSLAALANAENSDSLSVDIEEPLPSEPAPRDSTDTAANELPAPPAEPAPDEPEELGSPSDQPEKLLDEADTPPAESLDTEEPESESDSRDIEEEKPLEPDADQPQELSPPIEDSEEPIDEKEITPEEGSEADDEITPDKDLETQEPEPEPVKTGSELLQELQRDTAAWQEKVDLLQPLIERFDTQIIPFCYFSMYSLLLELPDRAEEAETLYQQIQDSYPRNMYSAAAKAIKEGRSPRLVDPAYSEALAAFDAALDSYPEAPDSLVTLMQEYRESDYDDLKLRANYRLGWYYSFEEPDTTLAREYLTAVLDDPENAEYASTVRRFFDGNDFLLRDSGLVDSTAVVADSTAAMDTTEEPESPADSTFTGPMAQEEASPDSLKFEIDLPAEPLPEELPELTEPAMPDSLQGMHPEPQEGAPEPETQPEELAPEPETQPDGSTPEPEAQPEEKIPEPDIQPEEGTIEPDEAPFETDVAPPLPQDTIPQELPPDLQE